VTPNPDDTVMSRLQALQTLLEAMEERLRDIEQQLSNLLLLLGWPN